MLAEVVELSITAGAGEEVIVESSAPTSVLEGKGEEQAEAKTCLGWGESLRFRLQVKGVPAVVAESMTFQLLQQLGVGR